MAGFEQNIHIRCIGGQWNELVYRIPAAYALFPYLCMHLMLLLRNNPFLEECHIKYIFLLGANPISQFVGGGFQQALVLQFYPTWKNHHHLLFCTVLLRVQIATAKYNQKLTTGALVHIPNSMHTGCIEAIFFSPELHRSHPWRRL